MAQSKSAVQHLFNGQDLKGWQHVGDGHFVVEHGLLKTQGGMGLLWYTRKKFGNALIRVVYKTSYPDSNSGIFVRIGTLPKSEWDAVHQGYEVQICDAGKDATDDYHRTGAIFSISKALATSSKGPNNWNTYEIKLIKNKMLVYLNGIKVNEFNPNEKIIARQHDFEPKRGPRPVYGYIGVQNHDHNATHKNSHVYFKEISVHPLPENEQA